MLSVVKRKKLASCYRNHDTKSKIDRSIPPYIDKLSTQLVTYTKKTYRRIFKKPSF